MLLDGNVIKNNILDEVREEVLKLDKKLKLVVIYIGNDSSTDIYIKQKKKMCEYVGYDFDLIRLDNDVIDEDVISLIDKLNNDSSVTGIMVQLPLPKQMDMNKIINSIIPCKDVDGLTSLNRGNLFSGNYSLVSCTALGIIELLHRYNISLAYKNIVIVGRSNLVSKPLEMLLLDEDATVTVCHSKTNNLSMYTKTADILVVSVGKTKLITVDMIKDGSIVIDVGINTIDDGICGDVDFSSVKEKVKYITPVPGGVGPMTVAMLAKNILSAYKMQK